MCVYAYRKDKEVRHKKRSLTETKKKKHSPLLNATGTVFIHNASGVQADAPRVEKACVLLVVT